MKICLYSLEQVGVIVLSSSGPTYFNRVGGGADNQAQGYFVPLSNDCPKDQPELALAPRLSAATEGGNGLTPQQAVQIENLLLEVSSSDRYRLDRSRLGQCLDGWVYVEILPQGDFSHFGPGDSLQAVLTWPCSKLD